MAKSTIITAAVVLAVIGLTGCNKTQEYTTGGAALGAGAGALIGAGTGNAGTGALIGAVAGGAAGAAVSD